MDRGEGRASDGELRGKGGSGLSKGLEGKGGGKETIDVV